MKLFKKSHAKVITFIIALLVIVIVAFLRHPSLKSFIFSSYNHQQSWKNLHETLSSNKISEAQNLWQFREFYSRGTIYLAKYQNLTVPTDISSNFQLPTSFIPHTLYLSDQIQSIEGTIDNNSPVFFTQENLPNIDWAETYKSEKIQIIENNKINSAIIIGVFNIEEASIANGYLYFDFRDEEFQTKNSNNKWLVVSVVNLF